MSVCRALLIEAAFFLEVHGDLIRASGRCQGLAFPPHPWIRFPFSPSDISPLVAEKIIKYQGEAIAVQGILFRRNIESRMISSLLCI